MSARRTQYVPYLVSLAIALSVACFVVLMAGPARGSEVDESEFEDDQAVVKLKEAAPGTNYEDLADAVATDFEVSVGDQLPGGGGRYFLFELELDSDEEFESEALSADQRVEYAEVNYAAEPPSGNVRFRAREESSKSMDSTNSYALSSLGLPCARKSGATGAGSTVAVLDTGADLRHPKLRDNFAGVPMYDFVDDEGEGDSDPSATRGAMAGHGTHVAGIVDIVAPGAKIMPLRVLNGQGNGNAVAIAKAIAFAQQNGADVLNLSLSTPDESRVVDDYLDAARAGGIVVAAAAGNDNTSTLNYPAANSVGTDGLLAVTAVDKKHRKSSFASYGAWVDVAAPGNAIRSAYPTSEYANLSGTSMSTPFVAGEAALLDAQDPARTPAEIEALIKGAAAPLDALNPAFVGMLGAGEADVGASVDPTACS